MLADDQPCQRLLRLGAGALSDAELVALVAGIEAQGRDDVALGHELILECGGLRSLATAFPEEVTRSSGIDLTGAVRLIAAFYTGPAEIAPEELQAWAAERLASMTPPGHEAVIHVTLTDDHPWAQAFVVIEARPLAAPAP